MAAAAERAAAHGVRSMVGFTYRRVPGHRAWPAGWWRRAGSARSGTCVRSTSRTGSSTRSAPMTWRLEKDKAGSGALGDIGAHIVDLTQYITGDRIVTVNGLLETFVHERPLAGRTPAPLLGGDGRERSPAPRLAEVTVDDTAVFLARFGGGAVGVFEATRFATGRKNAIRDRDQRLAGQPRLRLRGHERPAVLRRRGAVRRRPASGGSSSPSRSTPTSAAGGRPVTGSATSTGSPTRSSTSSTAIGRGEQPLPSFADGLQVQRVLAAVERSAEAGYLAVHGGRRRTAARRTLSTTIERTAR